MTGPSDVVGLFFPVFLFFSLGKGPRVSQTVYLLSVLAAGFPEKISDQGMQ